MKKIQNIISVLMAISLFFGISVPTVFSATKAASTKKVTSISAKKIVKVAAKKTSKKKAKKVSLKKAGVSRYLGAPLLDPNNPPGGKW